MIRTPKDFDTGDRMKSAKAFVALFLAVALFGCANLEPVRKYSSAAMATVTDSTTRQTIVRYSTRANTFSRTFGSQSLDVANAKALSEDIEKIQALCSQYLETLGTLAGADFATLTPEISSLAASIKAFPESGITARSVDAYASLATALSNALLSFYQQKKVTELVERGGPHFNELLSTLIRVSETSDEAISEYSRIMIGATADDLVKETRRGNTLVARVAHDWVTQNREQLKRDIAARQALRRALAESRLAHEKLAAQLRMFDAVATYSVLRPHLESIYKALKQVKENG
jgi:hypothetical protein